jgi:hypothetical protein
MTPKFLAEEVGEIIFPEIEMEVEGILEHWCGEPMRRYSVLVGLRQRRFAVNQE